MKNTKVTILVVAPSKERAEALFQGSIQGSNASARRIGERLDNFPKDSYLWKVEVESHK